MDSTLVPTTSWLPGDRNGLKPVPSSGSSRKEPG